MISISALLSVLSFQSSFFLCDMVIMKDGLNERVALTFDGKFSPILTVDV